MPIIDEVGEGSLPAKEKACMVVFCLMRTGRAIDCNLFRPGLWGWVGSTGGRQHGAKQRAELRVSAVEEQRIKSLEAPLARPSRAVLACTSKRISSLILLLCRQAWASEVRLD